MDYAQSRLQARFGERPDELLWQRLEAALDPAATLGIARCSGLRRWLAGIAEPADSHAIEIGLRMRWRECVSEIAGWMPAGWQQALLWTRGLVDLPALCHLARGGAPSPWMLSDPELQAYARADERTRQIMLRTGSCAFLKPLLEAPDRPAMSGICRAWLDEWRRRWPRWCDTSALDQLAKLLDTAIRQPAATGRPELLRKLRRLFRGSVLHPVAAFIYITFVALDIERLRAALLKHALAREGILAS